MKYRISSKALEDIDRIWLYTLENWSLEQADRYYNIILDEIEFIAENPNDGKDYNSVRKGYLRSKVKSHFIFYKFSSTELEIMRVLHESMDIPNRL